MKTAVLFLSVFVRCQTRLLMMASNQPKDYSYECQA
jgi:hypothetical protein